MPIKTIIAKNITGSPVSIPEFGVEIAGGASYPLSEYFRLEEIQESTTLTTLINASSIRINDGVGDLNQSQSLNFVTPPIADVDVDATLNAASATPAANVIARYDANGLLTLKETGGPTNLTFGAVADGQVVQRSGATLIGASAAVLTSSAPANVTKATAVVGVATTAARADHKHDVSTAAPATGIGGANAEGSATTVARSDHNHALRETGGPTDLTIAAVPDGQFLRRSGTTIVGSASVPASATTVSAGTTVTTTSGTDALLSGMTITPGAGTYLVMASLRVSQSTNVQSVFASIYTNNGVTPVQVTNSERQYTSAATSAVVSLSLLCEVTVAAGVAIEVRWRRSANTGTCINRSLSVLRIG